MVKVTVNLTDEEAAALVESHSILGGGTFAEADMDEAGYISAIWSDYAANALRAKVGHESGQAAASAAVKHHDERVGRRAERAAAKVERENPTPPADEPSE